MNEIPKVVFSNSTASADWDETTIAAGDLAESDHAAQAGALRRISARPRRGTFRRSLVEAGLIDEYRLVVHPVVLGTGERLFLAPLTSEPMSTTASNRCSSMAL
jgi:dihydrofolate reductase